MELTLSGAQYGGLQALLANITLAYFIDILITTVKSFILQAHVDELEQKKCVKFSHVFIRCRVLLLEKLSSVATKLSSLHQKCD